MIGATWGAEEGRGEWSEKGEARRREFPRGFRAHAGEQVATSGDAGECGSRPLARAPRFMFDDVAALRPYKATADVLAEKADWGPLYDTAALGANRTPAAAVAYVEDLYVDYDMAMVGGTGKGAAAASGALAPCRLTDGRPCALRFLQ